MTVGNTGDSFVFHQSQRPGPQAGVGLENNSLLVTEISDRLGSQQGVALVLQDCGSGQTLQLTELQQLQQLPVAEVTNTQTADLLTYKLAHITVGLQPHLGRPVERNHLEMMKNISSVENYPPPAPPYLC